MTQGDPSFYLLKYAHTLTGVRTVIHPHKELMQKAIEQALKARGDGDYAVGSVVVRHDGRIIGFAGNRSRRDNSPLAHAELLAIDMTAKLMSTRHLQEFVLYSTHEPCPMCSAAIVWAKMKAVVFGARISDLKEYGEVYGNDQYLWRVIEISCAEVIRRSPEQIEVFSDFMRTECLQLFHNK
jgi:tRNA(Arg) A34 adenosine deaminase TadA